MTASENDLAAENRQLRESLRQRVAELERAHVENQSLKADVAVKQGFIDELRIASPQVEREIELLRQDQAKLNRIRAVVRAIPFAHRVTGLLGRRAVR